MKLTLKIWRQKNAKTKGGFVTYRMDNVSPEMAFLEMLDSLNKKLVEEDKDPVAFDHDCREGICGYKRASSRTCTRYNYLSPFDEVLQ
jgi:succinate dehydrogenase / fumarate reductase iron-sulfur subunit